LSQRAITTVAGKVSTDDIIAMIVEAGIIVAVVMTVMKSIEVTAVIISL
jgi:cytochrome c oxidase subunit IV